EPADGWLKLHQVPATWSDARLRCHAEGAVLASPLTYQLRDAVINLVSQQSSVNIIFTGVHATLSKGDYASIEDVKCTSVFPYVCYKKRAALVVTGCGTTDPEYNLDVRTGSCYKFHRRGLTWSRAYMTCMAEGAHLAIINSEQESTVLKELFDKNPQSVIFSKLPDIASIGFLDWGDGGSWMTIHGETLEEAGFSHWHGSTPDNYTRAPEYSPELCGSIFRSGFINDIACDLKLPFIYKFSKDNRLDNIFVVLPIEQHNAAML
ncbi:Lipopolysaccharide binding protein, partial [Operophtera brumata]